MNIKKKREKGPSVSLLSSLSLFPASCSVSPSLSLCLCLSTHVTHTCTYTLYTRTYDKYRCIFNFRETVNFVLENTFFWNWVLTLVTLLFHLLNFIKIKCNGLNLKPARTTVSVFVKWFLSFSPVGTCVGRRMGYCSVSVHWLLLCDRTWSCFSFFLYGTSFFFALK